jgi:hypothetical protein
MLAIGGPGGSSSSSALAIRDPSGGALMKTKKDGKSNESASQNASRFKRKKAIKPAKVRLPNVTQFALIALGISLDQLDQPFSSRPRMRRQRPRRPAP